MCLHIQSSTIKFTCCRNEAKAAAVAHPLKKAQRVLWYYFTNSTLGQALVWYLIILQHFSLFGRTAAPGPSQVFPLSYMGGRKPKLNRSFWVSRSCSQLLRLRIMKSAVKSPGPFMDSQPSSFDHFKWYEGEKCSEKWKISHSAQVSQRHKISFISASVCKTEVRQDKKSSTFSF